MNKLRISSCSLNQTPMDWSGNLKNIQQAINVAHESGSELLITQNCAFQVTDAKIFSIALMLPTEL